MEFTITEVYSKSKPKNVYQERGDHDRYYTYFNTYEQAKAHVDKVKKMQDETLAKINKEKSNGNL
jgi:hypothetical protein